MPLYQAVNCPIFTCTEPSVFGFCSPSFCDEASARSGCSAAKSHRESARSVRKSDCKLGPKNLETFTPNPNHLDRPASTSNLGHRILRTSSAIGCPDGKAHVANASKGRDSVLSCTSAGLACAFTWAKLC